MSQDRSTWSKRAGRWLRFHLLRAVRQNSSAAGTSLGLALGVFVGIFPSFMIGTPLAFYLAGKMGLNRAAAAAGTVISMNPVTAPFIYSFSAWLGLELLGREIQTHTEGLLSTLQAYAGPFLLGSAVVAASIAILLGSLMFLAVRRTGVRGMRRWLARPKQYRARPTRPSPPPAAGVPLP